MKKQSVARRKPRQDRARQTQLLIFEAAARILEEEGLEHFNTNRLAELSGFSVGTIYQYFADKQAILQALAYHEHEKTIREIRKSLTVGSYTAAEGLEAPRVRAIVRAVLRAFGGRQRARKILIGLASQGGWSRQFEAPVAALAALMTSGTLTGPEGATLTLTNMDAFVLTQAVIGVIRAALARDERMLKKPELEEALVALIDSFVRSRVEGAPRR